MRTLDGASGPATTGRAAPSRHSHASTGRPSWTYLKNGGILPTVLAPALLRGLIEAQRAPASSARRGEVGDRHDRRGDQRIRHDKGHEVIPRVPAAAWHGGRNSKGDGKDGGEAGAAAGTAAAAMTITATPKATMATRSRFTSWALRVKASSHAAARRPRARMTSSQNVAAITARNDQQSTPPMIDASRWKSAADDQHATEVAAERRGRHRRTEGRSPVSIR